MGSDEQQQSPSWRDAERERRRQALAALARQAQPASGDATTLSSPSGSATVRPVSLAPRRTRPARRGLLVALLAAVVLAGAGTAFWHARQPQAAAQRPIPTTLTIQLRQKGLYCPSGVTWSPEGLTIAVFALRTDCRSAGIYYPVLALFDARTGALEHVIAPYSTLARLTDTNHALGSFIWSRDGKSLIFFVGYQANLVNASLTSGLLILPLDGGSPHYVSGPAVSYPGAVIWNLDTNTAASIVDTLSAAASYSWTADGHIIADATQSHASGHISLWQSGILNPVQPVVNDGPAFLSPPVTLFWASVRTLVSSDGRYAVAGLTLNAQVPTLTSPSAPKIDAKTCGYFEYEHLCEQPVLPYPDDAFAVISADASSGYTYVAGGSTNSFTQWNTVQVAYRPDGKVLAAILPNAVPQDNPSEERITFFDAASGAQLGILTATVVSEASLDTPGIPFLVWSPSGKQLAFFDYGASTVTLWGGASLPA